MVKINKEIELVFSESWFLITAPNWLFYFQSDQNVEIFFKWKVKSKKHHNVIISRMSSEIAENPESFNEPDSSSHEFCNHVIMNYRQQRSSQCYFQH